MQRLIGSTVAAMVVLGVLLLLGLTASADLIGPP